MAQTCVDGAGNVLHFPAGTYYEQNKNLFRRAELDAMRWTAYIGRVLQTDRKHRTEAQQQTYTELEWYRRTGQTGLGEFYNIDILIWAVN